MSRKPDNELAKIGKCGLTGTVVAMALSFAYPDLPIWAWRLIFWTSFTVMSCAMAFLIWDIGVRPRMAGCEASGGSPEKRKSDALELSFGAVVSDEELVHLEQCIKNPTGPSLTILQGAALLQELGQRTPK